MENLLILLGISFAINLTFFLIAFVRVTDKLTDITYASTFALLAAYSYFRSTRTTGHLILLAVVLLWSIRLGSFLLVRISKVGKDSRFDKMRSDFFRFLSFWIIQAMSVFVILLPSALSWADDNYQLSWLSLIGLLVFGKGLMLEAVADIQKFRFNSNKENAGKWIDEGVWRLSRHPNYLGEMLVWTGVYIMTFAITNGLVRNLIGALSPLYIICLLSFVSGIPILEKSADERWLKIKNYQVYKKEVPILIPSVKSIKRFFK